MDSNSRLWLFLHHNKLTSPLFLFHFSLVCSCLSDIQQWWKFKALMMGRLSDPPKQLDGMSERLCEFVKNTKDVSSLRGQPSNVHKETSGLFDF